MSWLVQDKTYEDNKVLLKNESLFNVSNGYIGVRGNFEEGYEAGFDTIRGTYLNAFYEIEPITYGEKLHGFPDTKQKILNVIDSQTIHLYIEGKLFSLAHGEVIDFARTLNMKEGTVTRSIHWRSPKGHEVIINIERLTSFHILELFLIRYTVEAINFDGEIKFFSSVNGDIENYTDETDPRTGAGHGKCYNQFEAKVMDNMIQVSTTTIHSKLKATCTCHHHVDGKHELNYEKHERKVTAIISADIEKNQKITLTKYNIYTDDRRHGSPQEDGKEILKKVTDRDFVYYLDEQIEYLKKFWKSADIIIGGDESLQQGIHYNVYQLLQSVGKDKYSNIAAKGMSGEGYEGHYFWDTEIYIFPFFLLTQPELAKKLLIYRHSILDGARNRAKEMGHERGALYPWRTINGDECSPFFPAGTAQYHINADIAYAVIQYYMITKDTEFMIHYGAEILFETARLWADVGHFHHNQFMIHSVTGPDEYTCVVDNNYYTNVMAKHNLKWAYKMYELLKDQSVHMTEVIDAMGLTTEEVEKWQKAYENMYLPYDEALGINPQDDTFLTKKVWDINSIPKNKFPLLLHYHPLLIYRCQICKQADTVLAHFLLEDEQSYETIDKSYHYYENITTHDSSLSFGVFSIMAAKVGEEQKAYDYFMKSARLDLDDHHGNTKHGIHTANMGGTYLGIVYGFGGLRIKEDIAALNPRKPDKWQKYAFKFIYQGRLVKVVVNESTVEIILEEGEALDIKVYEQVHTLKSKLNINIA